MEIKNHSSSAYLGQIKDVLNNSKYNLTTLNKEINKLNNTDTTVQNLSARLKKGSLKYDEVVQILDILGYKVKWEKTMRVVLSDAQGNKSMFPPIPSISKTSNDELDYYDKLLNEYSKLENSQEHLDLLNKLLISLFRFQISLTQALDAHKSMPDIFGTDDTFDCYLKYRREVEAIFDEIYKLYVGRITFEDLVEHFGYTIDTLSSLHKTNKED